MPISAADFDTVFEALLDRTAYLKAQTDNHDGSITVLDGRVNQLLLGQQWCTARTSGTPGAAVNAYLPLSGGLIQGVNPGPYVINGGNRLVVPAAGEYEVAFAATVKCTDTTNPLEFVFSLEGEALASMFVSRVWRRTATPGDYVSAAGSTICKVVTPAATRIGVLGYTSTNLGTFELYDYVLTIRRIL